VSGQEPSCFHERRSLQCSILVESGGKGTQSRRILLIRTVPDMTTAGQRAPGTPIEDFSRMTAAVNQLVTELAPR
jgi:hypothetical protein